MNESIKEFKKYYIEGLIILNSWINKNNKKFSLSSQELNKCIDILELDSDLNKDLDLVLSNEENKKAILYAIVHSNFFTCDTFGRKRMREKLTCSFLYKLDEIFKKYKPHELYKINYILCLKLINEDNIYHIFERLIYSYKNLYSNGISKNSNMYINEFKSDIKELRDLKGIKDYNNNQYIINDIENIKESVKNRNDLFIRHSKKENKKREFFEYIFNELFKIDREIIELFETNFISWEEF